MSIPISLIGAALGERASSNPQKLLVFYNFNSDWEFKFLLKIVELITYWYSKLEKLHKYPKEP
jgi:hypothetical protein